VIGPADHDGVLDAGSPLQGDVGVLLEWHHIAAAPGSVLGDDDAGVGVQDPGGESVGTEPSENNRVDQSQPGTGEHGDGQLGDHSHVDGDPITLLEPQALQGVGEPVHLPGEFAVGQRPGVSGLADPVVGNLVAMVLEVAIEAVVGDVQLPVLEPLEEGRIGVVETLRRLFEPGRFATRACFLQKAS
jgi:hypothetical protein